MAQGKGSHFDPDIIDGFLEIHENFRSIAISNADHEEERIHLAK
ncbi:MAG: hypothetical protein VW455_07590 [Nitrospinota bacterium]